MKHKLAKTKTRIFYRFGMGEGMAFVDCRPRARWKVISVEEGKIFLKKDQVTLKMPKEEFDKHWVVCDED